MSVELNGRVIRGVDMGNTAFMSRWKDLPSNVQDEAFARIKTLFGLNLDQAPAGLHMHQLVGKEVASRRDDKKKTKVWTLHITASDTYKASFTLEDGTAYFRTCGLHDVVDKKP